MHSSHELQKLNQQVIKVRLPEKLHGSRSITLDEVDVPGRKLEGQLARPFGALLVRPDQALERILHT